MSYGSTIQHLPSRWNKRLNCWKQFTINQCSAFPSGKDQYSTPCKSNQPSEGNDTLQIEPLITLRCYYRLRKGTQTLLALELFYNLPTFTDDKPSRQLTVVIWGYALVGDPVAPKEEKQWRSSKTDCGQHSASSTSQGYGFLKRQEGSMA